MEGAVHLTLTPAPAGQGTALSKVGFRQHSDGVLTHRWVQLAAEPPRPAARALPSPAGPPPPVTYLGLSPQVQFFKFCEGQIRKLVQAHWKKGGNGNVLLTTVQSAKRERAEGGCWGSGSYSGSCGCRRCARRSASCYRGRCAAGGGTRPGCTAGCSTGTQGVSRSRGVPEAPHSPGPAPSHRGPSPELYLQHPGLELQLLCGRERGSVSGSARLPRRRTGDGEAEPSHPLPVPLYLRRRAPKRRRAPEARPQPATQPSPSPTEPCRAEPS